MKEQITEEIVEELEVLVQLSLSKEERERAGRELTEILAYAQAVQDLVWTEEATSDFAPVLREDVVEESFPKARLLANAPEAEDGCFRVPRTIGAGRQS